jgi:hypothetical protein
VTDKTAEEIARQRGLLDDLHTISAALGPAGAAARIPVLNDIVELPRPGARASAANDVAEISRDGGTADPGQWPQDPGLQVDMCAALDIESAFIIDELIDDFLPLIEQRLRERLEARQKELLAAMPSASPPSIQEP